MNVIDATGGIWEVGVGDVYVWMGVGVYVGMDMHVCRYILYVDIYI